MKSKRLLSSWNVEHTVGVNVDFSTTCLHDLGQMREEASQMTVQPTSWC